MSELAARWKTISGRDRAENFVEPRPVQDIDLAEAEPPVAGQVADVLLAAEIEIVNAAHLVAARKQRIAEMAADETGPAGYQYPHLNIAFGWRWIKRPLAATIYFNLSRVRQAGVQDRGDLFVSLQRAFDYRVHVDVSEFPEAAVEQDAQLALAVPPHRLDVGLVVSSRR